MAQNQQHIRKFPQPLTFRAPDSDTQLRFAPGNRYHDALARKICEKIMHKQSLTSICKDPRMPNLSTVVRWLSNPKLVEFREMYYYARRVAAELYVDEIFEIADDGSNDWKPRYDKDGGLIDYVPDQEAIQRSRVRIDARKWYASKMVPKIYGDKTDVNLDVTGDLAELLKKASNNDKGLPKPVIEND
jgi:hypothetical protein